MTQAGRSAAYASTHPGMPTEQEINRTARATEERTARLTRATERIAGLTVTADVERGATQFIVDSYRGRFPVPQPAPTRKEPARAGRRVPVDDDWDPGSVMRPSWDGG